MDLKGMGVNTRNWLDSNHDTDYWRAFVNEVSYLWILKAMEFVS